MPLNDSDRELRHFPKVELHRHFELTMRPQTLRELATALGLEVPVDEAQFRQAYLITEPMSDLETVLKKFLVTQRLLNSEEVLTRMAFEAIEDACNEGIRILELRFAPTFIHAGHAHLGFARILAAIEKGLAMARHLPISVGLLATIQRILPVGDAERVVDFVIEHRASVLGIDLADNEEGFDPAPFAAAFQRGKKAGLRITVHAGEAPSPQAGDRVRDAIELLGAERIGHGVQIVHSPAIMALARDRKIALELCPTSNWLTNAVPSLSAHPFRQLMEAGVPVTINSDDPGIFAIDLTNEYRVLRDLHGFTAAEFTRCNDVAAAASFIPVQQKQKNWPRPIVSV